MCVRVHLCAVSSCKTLCYIDVMDCQWDDGMIDFALAVRGCKDLLRLNKLMLNDEALEWDLRGCLKNVFDVAFVASRLESGGQRLTSMDLSCNSFTPEESEVLTRALAHAPNLTSFNGLSLDTFQLRCVCVWCVCDSSRLDVRLPSLSRTRVLLSLCVRTSVFGESTNVFG